MKTKIFTLLFAIVASVGTIFAVQIGDLYYSLNASNNEAAVVSMPSGKYAGDITIPASVEYESVTYSVTSIDFYAFYGCSSMTSIVIPNSVTIIYDGAFGGCQGLKSVIIGNSVSTIRDGAFDECSSLPIIDNIRYADTYLVEAVDKEQTSYIIKEGTKWIGENAFEGCANFKSIVIPNSVISMGRRVFKDCIGLNSIILPNTISEIDDETFRGCTRLAAITIPNSVTRIREYVFQGCTGLTSIIIPSSISEIGHHSFKDCTSLTSIVCEATLPPDLENNVFQYVDNTIPLYVPLGSLDAFKENARWSYYFTNILPIQAKDANATDVVFAPADNNVVVTWPKDDAATTYTIEIKKNGELVCTLSFNDLGQLLNINYASLVRKSKRSNGQPRMATQTTTGWQYEINSLDPATKYTYSVIAHGASEAKLYIKTGEFTTTKNGAIVTVYSVTFVDNNNQIIAIQQVEQGGAVIAPELEGYSIASTDKPLTDIQEDQTIKVLYNINTYTVRFLDWNDQELKSETVEYGKSAAAPVNPSREGYTFTGWDKEFSNVQSDLTVKAQYAIQTFVVKFVDWDDKELKSDTVEYGKSAIAPADPSREGYNFKGWDKEFTNVQSDLTVKARYTIQTFTVKFVDWDDKELKSETVEYGKSATAPADPSRDGYTFKGWDKEFTNVQSDLVVKAVYEKNPDEAIDEINAENVVSQKVLQNGQLLILRDGEIYNAQGARVK